jgi:rubrerythrin
MKPTKAAAKDEQLGIVLAAQARSAGRTELFAQKARGDDQPGLAALWRAVSASRRVQAGRVERLLRGKIPSDLDGARQAYETESADLRRDLNHAAQVARSAEAGIAAQALEHCGLVEERAAELYQASPQGDEGRSGPYLVCTVCGYLAQGEPPERCPVCGAVPDRFSAVD